MRRKEDGIQVAGGLSIDPDYVARRSGDASCFDNETKWLVEVRMSPDVDESGGEIGNSVIEIVDRSGGVKGVVRVSVKTICGVEEGLEDNPVLQAILREAAIQNEIKEENLWWWFELGIPMELMLTEAQLYELHSL